VTGILFAESVAARLNAAGLGQAELVSAVQDDASFGNAEVIFRAGSLRLRFVRDRGQEFLEMASDAAPTRFFQFDDVELALGRKTIREILAAHEPERLEVMLARLAKDVAELNDAFSGDRERLTRARVEQAARARGEAFMKWLRRDREDESPDRS
jgi:hypothetical protein